MLESTRKKEEEVKRETTEQLDVFRRQQEQADKAYLDEGNDSDPSNVVVTAGSPEVGHTQWAVNAKKRKRVKEKDGLNGVKVRKSSETIEGSKDSNRKNDETVKRGIAKAPISGVSEREQSQSKFKTLDATSMKANLPPASKEVQSPKQPCNGGLGLVEYSSDED